MRALLQRNQFILFTVLVFVISWIPWLTGGQGFFAWGPSLAGLIVVTADQGKKGLREMLGRLARWQVGIRWWGFALLGPLAFTLIAVAGHVLIGGRAPPFTFWKQEWNLAPILLAILLSPFGGAGGEEPFGWRGYAQSRLQDRWTDAGPLVASVVIGIIWAIWHLPEFFNPSSTQYAVGLAFIFPMTAMWIAASVIMTWLYNNTGGSVLVSGVGFHLMLDFSSTTLLTEFTLQGINEGIPPVDLRLLSIQILVFCIMALLLVLLTKGQLGFSVEKRQSKCDIQV